MPIQTFSSYEAYADAIQDASLRAIFLGKKHANWALSYLSMSNLSVQWGQVGGPGVIEGTVKPGGCVIVMPSQNAQAISGNGRRFDERSLMVLRPGSRENGKSPGSLIELFFERFRVRSQGLKFGLSQKPDFRLRQFFFFWRFIRWR